MDFDDSTSSDLAENIAELMRLTTNEPVLLARIRPYFSPQTATLAKGNSDRMALEPKLKGLAEKLGGIITGDLTEEGLLKLPQPDTYAASALQEMLRSFHRSSRSVERAHVFFIGASLVAEHPDWWAPPITTESAVTMSSVVERHFWEEAETAYIRLASYWDRTGQLLAFAYFNIRQYERDVFASVMDRIKVNYVPLYPQLAGHPSWHALRDFQNSEQETASSGSFRGEIS